MPGRNHEGERAVRLFQVWQGNERFFCGGRCIAGPNWKALLGTTTLILGPLVVFLVFVGPVLRREVNIAIPIVGGFLGLAALFFLFRTGCMDPGILMRQEPDEEYHSGRKNKTKEEIVNGHRVLVRYNETCHFYQPPRAHHCSVNDNCIEKFDHHCPWVGTTIGRRNYRWFLLFIFSASLLCIFVCATGIVAVKFEYDELTEKRNEGEKIDALDAIREAPAAVALSGYTALFFLFVGGLSIFHIYLVSTNQTTYENFRYGYDRAQNPYDEGCARNCWQVWFQKSPLPPIDFRAVQRTAAVPPVTPPPPATTVPRVQVVSFQRDAQSGYETEMRSVTTREYRDRTGQVVGMDPISGDNSGESRGSRTSSRSGSYVGRPASERSKKMVVSPSRIPSGASSKKSPPPLQVVERHTSSNHSSNHSSMTNSHDATSPSAVEVRIVDDDGMRGSWRGRST
ncbi:hypothetical protein BSKO_11216 [Bryopsis sp. KO-2023]|nr:hypothetical protein BSKO_11216 [Bryopsis sp. KO-2023]